MWAKTLDAKVETKWSKPLFMHRQSPSVRLRNEIEPSTPARKPCAILFKASADTLKTIAADPKHLGAKIAFTGLLHTWGQTLRHHPHIHYVIPGGGPSLDGQAWVSCRPGFFLPVEVLSQVFRGKFLDFTRQAFDLGELSFQGHLAPLTDPKAFAEHLAPTYEIAWNVYAKPSFGKPVDTLKYLARYTHRVAISNDRLVSLQDADVRFRWKDYARGYRRRIMELSAVEFIRRFLLHVLPKRFVRTPPHRPL